MRLSQNCNSGAGVGIRVGLQNLFNDNSEEAKLLAFQLELLKKLSAALQMNNASSTLNI